MRVNDKFQIVFTLSHLLTADATTDILNDDNLLSLKWNTTKSSSIQFVTVGTEKRRGKGVGGRDTAVRTVA